MVISVDLPADIVTKLDETVKRERERVRRRPPVWPFAKRRVEMSKLSIAEYKKLQAFQNANEAFLAYKENKKSSQYLHSRSAVIRQSLISFLEGNENGKAK